MAAIQSLSSTTGYGAVVADKTTTVQPDEAVSAQARQEQAVPSYLSPVIQVDAGTGLAVTEIRNTDTGEALSQYPTRHILEEYARSIHHSADNGSTETVNTDMA